MPALPDDIATILAIFAPLFMQPTFQHAKLLLLGADRPYAQKHFKIKLPRILLRPGPVIIAGG